jgi:hypothetical protein
MKLIRYIQKVGKRKAQENKMHRNTFGSKRQKVTGGYSI